MKRKYIFLSILIVFTLLTPLAYQTTYLQADEADYYSKIQKGLTYFQKVYDRVQSHYVEEIDPYEFVKAGIDGMLDALDPYTVFIEEEADTRLRIITTGRYGGVGMEIGMRNDQITVISPMDNSPAKKAGIKAGDILKKINGKDISDNSLERISQQLRGPIGSKVELSVLRPGYDNEIMMTIERDEIIIDDVNFADMIQPGVAYIRLTGFTDKAGPELEQAIKDIEKKGDIKALILDLRGNSGGLLEAAVDVLGLFLPKETTVVTTRGFRDGEHTFQTHTDPLLLDAPLAVLVDQGSASASEIVAGALQDLDRAIIVGTETFGKGLVQKVYNIDKNSSTKIKITTAKYYIPSGRCVQKKDYTESNAIFYNTDKDTLSLIDQASQFYTTNQRKVYEKGGIMPDRYVKSDDVNYIVTEFWKSSLLFNFAVDYYQHHRDWTGDIGVTDEIFKAFLAYTQAQNFHYSIAGENELNSFLHKVREADLPASLITSGEELLNQLNSLKESDILKHKKEIEQALFSELTEKYYDTKEKIAYSLKQDEQLHEAIDVVLNKGEYKKILAIK
jgi:carboxyl-terminal processing protease